MRWAVILAGGSGLRLRPLTRALMGDDRPKQFCPLLGSATLLAQTRARLRPIVDAERSLCVVTREHEQYYRRELSDMKPAHVLEQPANLGTAAAIAYGFARVGSQDPKAVVGFYPADHHFDDDEALRRVIDQTYRMAQQRPDLLFLLGTEPDCPEIEYGWIEPGVRISAALGPAFTVRHFREKPSLDVACELVARGCLWNMFILIGSLGAFRTILHAAVPEMVRAFELVERFPMARADTVQQVYQSFRPVDFSSQVLPTHLVKVAVVRVPHVGWSDLGQSARVDRILSAQSALRPVIGAAS